MGDVDKGGGYAYGGAGDSREIYITFSQFYCESKTSVKKKNSLKTEYIFKFTCVRKM